MTYQRANDAPQTYYYVLNLQGDVVKLIDENGAEVASMSTMRGAEFYLLMAIWRA